MMQRFLSIVMAFLVAAVIADNSLYLGERERNDYLLEQKKIDRKPDKGSDFSKVLQFTEPITIDGEARITRVEIIDYQQKKTSANARVVDGGPGYSSVTINFVSERGYGIHFIVKIYGKRHMSV